MPIQPNMRRLFIDVTTRVLPGDMGYLSRDVLRFKGAQNDMAAAAKRTADMASRDADRKAVASERADARVMASSEKRFQVLATLNAKLDATIKAQYDAVTAGEERVTRATERRARIQLQWQQAVRKGNLDAAERSALSWEQADRQVALSAKATADAQIAALARIRVARDELQRATLAADAQEAKSVKAANAAYDAQVVAQARASAAVSRATTVGRLSTAAGIASGAGTAALGVGGAGLVLGGISIDQAVKWQKFVSTNRANTQMTGSESQAFQQLALKIAAQTGASPNDVYLALRYGAEKGLSPAQNRRFLSTAIALGLPTGGTASESMQALTTVANNFPGMKANPRAIGNMILSASQQSAGITAPQFTAAMPRLLALAGAIGGQNQLPQALALTATLSRAGLPLDQAISQATNIIAKIVKPSTGTTKYIGEIDKAKGLNLASDFGAVALQKKGLAGVLNDLFKSNLGLGTLEQLFPNMRGLIGARALSGVQNQNFNAIYGNVLGAPGKDPLAANLKRYLGLDSTQISKLEEQLRVLAITTGTDLLPAFNHLLKDDIIPLVKGIDTFTKSNRALLVEVIKLSPWIFGAGVLLKGVGVSLRLIIAAKEAKTVIADAATALGLIKRPASAADASLAKLAARMAGGGTDTIEGASAAAIGDSGSGLIGLAASIGLLLGPIAIIGGALALIYAKRPQGSVGGYSRQQIEDERKKLQAGGARVNLPDDRVVAVLRAAGVMPVGTGAASGYPTKASLVRGASIPSMPSGWHPSQRLFHLPTSGAGTSSLAYQWNQPLTFTRNGKTVPEGFYRGTGSNGAYTTNIGGTHPAFHYDIATKRGQAVYLPGTGQDAYKVIGLAYQPTGDGDPGYVITFQSANGVVFTLGNIEELAGPGAHMPKMQVNSVWYGGWYVGRTGRGENGPHLHILGNAAAQRLFYGLSPHPTVQAARQTSGGGLTAQIAAAAKQRGVPADLLYGIYQAEGGTKAHPLFGDPSGTASGAAASLAANYKYALTPAGQALRKQYKFPATTQGNWDTALAIYNGGYTYDTRNDGYAHGAAYVSTVMQYAAKYGGKGPPINYTPPGTTKKGSRSNPQTPYQWAQNWASKASNLSGPVDALFTAAQLADPSKMSPTQQADYVGFIDSYLKYVYQEKKSYATAEYVGTRRSQAIAKAWNDYQKALKHPFANSPFGTTSAKNRPTTPMGWSQWYSTQASAQKSLADQQAAVWPNANLTDPNGIQRALLTPLIDKYYRDTYQSSVSLANANYKNNPKLLKEALTAAKTLLNRELAHPFANYFATSSAAQKGITPVALVGSNHQLAVTEKQLRVAEEQLKVLKKLDKNDAQQIKHLQQVIKTLVKELNKLGVHVGFSNGHLTGIVAVGGSGG